MRLIGMRFLGIGPYEKEYSIDFAALNRSRMFLIEGETGAGKSTILDCISFALYGDVSADVASKDRLRSRFLGTEQTPSYVDLIFELNDAFYRVRREPAYERRKRRGEGTTAVNPKGLLWQVDDGIAALLPAGWGSDDRSDHDVDSSNQIVDDSDQVALDGTATRYFEYADDADHAKVLASQARDTGTEILRLLHLSRDQFSKTVMLAQGQFSSFLRCKPEERTQLVKSLFEADVYESIQKTLDEMRKTQSEQVTAQRRDVVSAVRDARANAEEIERRGDEMRDVASVDAASDADDISDTEHVENASEAVKNNPDNPDNPDPLSNIKANWCLDERGDLAEPALSPSDIAAALDDHLAAAETAAAHLLAHSHDALTASSTRLDDEQRKLDAMRQLSAADTAYRTAIGQRDELEQRRPDVDDIRERLQKSAAAEPVARAQRECEAVQKRRAQTDAALRATNEELAACESAEALTASRDKANAVAAGRPAAEAALHAAQELESRAASARASWKKAERADSQARSQAAATDAARDALSALEREHSESDLRQQLEDVIRREAARPGLQDRLQAARTVLDHARKRQAEESSLEQLQAAVDQALRNQRHADDEYEQARRAFFAAGAARLAGELVDGCPCPVCGSVEHPHPAATPSDAVALPDDATDNVVAAPDENRLNALDQAARQAAQQVIAANAAVDLCKARIASETEQSQGLSVEDAEAAVAQVRKELDEVRALGKTRDQLNAQLQALHDAVKQVDDCVRRLDVAQAEASCALELVRAAVESCVASVGLPESVVDSDDAIDPVSDASDSTDSKDSADELAALAARIDAVETRASDDERAANDAIAVCDRAVREVARIDRDIAQRTALEQRIGEVAAALQEIDRQLAAIQETRDQALSHSGFETVEAALNAELDARETQRLQSAVERFDRDDHATQSELQRTLTALQALLESDIVRLTLGASGAEVLTAEVPAGVSTVEPSGAGTTSSPSSMPSPDGLELLPEPDRLHAIIRTLESSVRQAESERDAAIRTEEQVKTLDVERMRTAETLRTAVRTWSDSSTRFAPIRDMALLAGGRAGSLATGTANEGLSLVTYAVTERFRDVLARANEILGDIKGGVYELRLGAHEGRTSKTGLPIEVFDRRSDLTCEATTLSGGETFFVSLALALALADIIQAENGGISMDTLFIDEGFGTLSEEYLDDVLDVLRRMSRHRDIGVISHVGQLKDQIAERISVTRINEDSASRITVTV
ncbi:hypothetical protein EMO89_10520 [Bifidobacterium tissieri]|uniref:Nuclease SbcCD subunit C n=1 Tax=Bifidobacterium tissieri TaxID=1630162 RepID=A0A5M9ZJD0_9BIFI|nr:AAA family ATPase [Bifidobacterium tissieri]KAA8827579.1 hypothetical protein EMO89_10520 [Bifidobacterium tissieri]